MSDEETVAQETPSTETETPADGSDEASEQVEGAGEGLPGDEGTEAASQEGEAAETAKPAPDDHEKALRSLQSAKDREVGQHKARIAELEQQLAGLQAKPAEPGKDPTSKLKERVTELQAYLADNYDPAALSELARAEAKLTALEEQQSFNQTQTGRAQQRRAIEITQGLAPRLYAAKPEDEDYGQVAQERTEIRGMLTQMGLIDHPWADLVGYAVYNLNQRQQELAKAEEKGALAEQKRKAVVKSKGGLAPGQRKGSAPSLTASQLETAKLYHLTPEQYAKSLAALKGGEVNGS